jgi:hypothetical protein
MELSIYGNIKNKKLEIRIMPSIERVGEAEAIFQKYNAKKISQMGANRSFDENGISVYVNGENPDKMIMTYIIDPQNFNSIKQEFCDSSIAGFDRHNKVYHRPFGIKKKLSSLLFK